MGPLSAVLARLPVVLMYVVRNQTASMRDEGMTGETIGDYLIRRLHEEDVGHVFGVPGDFVLGLFKKLEDSPLKIINTCDEQGAGFAADAYARLRGLGVVCITYAVGGLKVVNAVAQAFAEWSPVVVVSGAPGIGERVHGSMIHHTVRDFDSQRKVFSELTVATVVLDNPATAASEIDRALKLARRHSRPVYIELPRDMVSVELLPGREYVLPAETSDAEVLRFAIAEAVEKIGSAKRPVILAGLEIHRFGLQHALAKFAHATGIPVAATLGGKSVFAESDLLYLGLYEGAMGSDAVRDYVEQSDCVILLGAMLTDINLGIYTAHIDRSSSIYAGKDRVSVGFRSYDGVLMEDFMQALSEHSWTIRRPADFEHLKHPGPFAAGERPMTVAALFHQINAFLREDMVVIADPGDALFGAGDLYIHDGTHFLAPAYYCSLGFAIPAAIGMAAAAPNLRPLVLVGDGAFQMTGMELSTIARYGMNPIVIVLDNDGYGTERPMLDGAFNDVHRWNFAEIPLVLGAGLGIKVGTETEMAAALERAGTNLQSYTLIQVMLERNDHSPALSRLAARLGERVAKRS
ncbi:MAG: alpha-keto acid decarboxylase family protein [Xanthobacteraceae bacterium]|nr:alpha-keto acid decarboxylase family protein [Xanthobacteraceae bacterium]